MQNHADKRILALWEAGRGHSAAARALAMLECAFPDSSPQELVKLPLGRRDALLLATRQCTLGETLLAVTNCPNCDAQVEAGIPCATLIRKPGTDELESTLAADGYQLSFRLLDSEDLIAADACNSNVEASALLIERCVSEARHHGQPVPVSTLPQIVLQALAQRLVSGDPQAETVFELRCPDCEETWCCDLDVPGFLWQELRAHALSLLDDIHTLACAYNWSESEILALGPVRRQSYLERVRQ